MKFRYVEMFTNAKLDHDILVLMKGFQALFESIQRYCCVGLELGIVDEVNEGMCNYIYLPAYGASQNT